MIRCWSSSFVIVDIGIFALNEYKGRLSRYGDFHFKEKTDLRQYNRLNVNPYTGKTPSLYWDGPLLCMLLLLCLSTDLQCCSWSYFINWGTQLHSRTFRSQKGIFTLIFRALPLATRLIFGSLDPSLATCMSVGWFWKIISNAIFNWVWNCL